jgi:hypothetical protein
MRRKLNAIEIAEGAVLADIAILFQLLAIYVPIADTFFRLLIFIVFAVLVLRRGLYVGIVALCVALFIVGALTGVNFLLPMLLQGVGGLYLGLTMKYRLGHIRLLLLGVSGGAIAVWSLTLLFTLLAGVPLSELAHQIERAYIAGTWALETIAAQVGLAEWWRQSVAPTLATLAQLALAYWALSFLALLWLFLFPVVVVIYYMTNLFVRLLGYDVRPFPGGWVNRLIQRIARRLVKIGIRRGLIGRDRAEI